MSKKRIAALRLPKHTKCFSYGKPRITKCGAFFYPGPDICKEHLRATFERQFDSLPKEYSRFLLECNGGIPQASWFVYENSQGAQVTELSRIYGIRDDDEYCSLLAWNKALEHRLPAGVLAVGCSIGEDQIVMSLREDDRGSTYLWELRTRKKPTKDNLLPLERSFSAFLKGLLGNTGSDMNRLLERVRQFRPPKT